MGVGGARDADDDGTRARAATGARRERREGRDPMAGDDASDASDDAWRAHVREVGLGLFRALARDARELSASEDAETAEEAARNRVYRYYVPVYEEVVQRLRMHRRKAGTTREGRTPKPMVVGVRAPQGCGKTTLTRTIVDMIKATPKKFLDDSAADESGNVTAVTLSIDDFYLAYEDQAALGEANPGNAMLRYRGNAGTHDLALGSRSLQSLARINDSDGETSKFLAPRYDKLARDGRGDRKPQSEWESVSAPLDVVLLEGWMLGFEPIESDRARAINPDLVVVNERLKEYKAALWGPDNVAWWIIFKVDDPAWVYDWRLEAERKANGGLDDSQVKDFVDRFMPAYEAYLPGLYVDPPPESLVVVVDKHREVLMVHVSTALDSADDAMEA